MGGEAESLLVTGGADARVAVWRDCTAADAAAAAAGAAEAALKAQQLSNALQAPLPCIFRSSFRSRLRSRVGMHMYRACATPALRVMGEQSIISTITDAWRNASVKHPATALHFNAGCVAACQVRPPHNSCFRCPMH